MASVAVAPRRDSQLVVERNNGGMGKILIIELEDVVRSIKVNGHVLFETLGTAKRTSRPFSLSGTPGGVRSDRSSTLDDFASVTTVRGSSKVLSLPIKVKYST